MVDHTVISQLTCERDHDAYLNAVRGWFAWGVPALGGDLVAELEAAPPRADALRGRRVGQPVGEPGSVWGSLSVVRRYPKTVRRSRRVYSAQQWHTFLGGLDREVVEAVVLLCHLDDDGFVGVGGVSLRVVVCEDDPNWVYLEALVGESWLPAHAHQRALLEYVRAVADLANPSFGQVGYIQSIHRTALETALGMIPDEELFKSRWRLRGYGWLTICSQRIGDELGGLAALRDSAAFAEVAQLKAGGYWLLATPTYQEYDLTAVHRIFRVLAPKLPAGRPVGVIRDRVAGPPIMLVDQDAADVAALPDPPPCT